MPYSLVREKVGRDDFFARKIAFFLKNMCFQQPRRWYGNDLITCTITVTILCGFCKLFLEVFHIRQYDKMSAEKVFSVEIDLFFSKTCVFNNLLGVTERILELAQ